VKSLFVKGVGLWAPGYPDAKAWLAGTASEDVVKPPVDLAPSRMKRATSINTLGAVEAVTQAGRDAGWDLSTPATVFGSAHGEIQIAVDQMEMMHDGDGKISPARFKNSVHNTAAGLFSIAAKNKGFTTAIAAGPNTFAMSLFEAGVVVLSGRASRAIVCVSEEPLPEPIDRFVEQKAMAIAFAIDAEPGDRRLTLPSPAELGPREVPGYEGHPAAPALALLRALEGGESGRFGVGPGWTIEVGA